MFFLLMCLKLIKFLKNLLVPKKKITKLKTMIFLNLSSMNNNKTNINIGKDMFLKMSMKLIKMDSMKFNPTKVFMVMSI